MWLERQALLDTFLILVTAPKQPTRQSEHSNDNETSGANQPTDDPLGIIHGQRCNHGGGRQPKKNLHRSTKFEKVDIAVLSGAVHHQIGLVTKRSDVVAGGQHQNIAHLEAIRTSLVNGVHSNGKHECGGGVVRKDGTQEVACKVNSTVHSSI